MTTPSGPDARPPSDGEPPRVDLGKGSGGDDAAQAETAFDPYRFGRPDHPVPPEYAPPGYVPDPPSAASSPPGVYPPSPYGQSPYGQPPYGQSPYGQSPYGQPPYGQSPQGQPYSPYPTPYGHPPPYGHPGYVPPRGNGKAVTALVCGIAGIVFCWLSFFALLVIVPAFVFGFIALNDAKSRGGAGRGMAIAGIACAVVAALLATLLTVLVFRAADRCGGFENQDRPGFQQCIQDEIL